jgi:hypothetical protein
MRRTAVAAGVFVLVTTLTACSNGAGGDDAELCQHLTNLQGTMQMLASPPRDATVGEVRGNLDKLDGTWDAVHDHPDVPDDEDDALVEFQEDYRDAIEGVGDDDAFAPYVPATRGSAEGMMRAYQAVRVRLVCPSYLQPG